MPAEDRKPRNLFPLPVCQPGVRLPRHGLSRGCARRLLRANAVEAEVHNTVQCLNAMYSGGDIDNGCHQTFLEHGASFAQTKALEFIKQSVHEMGAPPEDLSCQGALELLRATGVYGGDQAPCALGSYDPALLSLPEAGNQPVPLEELWGRGGHEFVGTFIRNVVLPESVAKSRIRESGLRQCYSDPLLRHPKSFSQLVKRLHDCGLVSYSLQPSTSFVELFFVKKKNGMLRMVVDCRHSNEWFVPPIGVALATGDALSRIEINPHEQLHFASADLKDAFYHLGLPAGIRHLFGLRGVRACDVGVDELNGIPVPWHQMIYPQLAAVPMGWSWALYLCQTMHERIVGQIGADDTSRLVDKKPAPDTEVLHTEYVDNYHVIGTNSRAVTELSQLGIEALRGAGLVVHEEEHSTGNAQILGWEFSTDGTLRPTSRRLWKVRLGILHILRCGRVSGQQLERVVGHMSFISMIRREGLSILGDCYTFIRRHYYVPAKIWKSVRRELSIWYGISPLLWKNLAAEWSSTVYATDASDWGSGVTTANMDSSTVKDLGKYAERWRFKDDRWRYPRRSSPTLFSADEADDVVAHDWDQQQLYPDDGDGFGPQTIRWPELPGHRIVSSSTDAGLPNNSGVRFQPLPFSAVNRSWAVVGRWKWKRQESMPILEARATLFAVKHMVRSTKNFGKRMLVFSDSMTAVASISRGRASARGLVQQISALCLSSSLCLHVRWCPSEWNPADNPSRGGWVASLPKQSLDNGDPSKPQCSSHLPCSPTRGSGGSESQGQGFQGLGNSWPQTASGSDSTAVGFSDSSHSGCLYKTLDTIQQVVPANVSSPGSKRGSRQGADSVSGRMLSGWSRSECGSVCGSCSNLCATRPSQSSNAEAPKHKAELTGVEESLSTAEPSANSMGGCVSGQHVGIQEAAVADGCWTSPDVCNVPAAVRDVQAQGERCSASQSSTTKAPSKDSGDAPQFRGWCPVENTRVRRNDRARFRSPSVPDRNVAIDHLELGPSDGQLAFQSGHGSAPRFPSASPANSSDFKHRASSPVQMEARRSKHGLLGKASRFGCNSKAGQVEGNGVSQTLREGGPVSAIAEQAPRLHPRAGNMGKRKHRAGFLQPAPATAYSLTTPCFLEIFSGSGHLAKAVQQVTSWDCFTWDILHGSEYDLRSKKKRNRILGWIKSGKIQGVHLGTPCSSFSRARDRRPGPPPLRSDQQPLGFENLGPADMAKVREGNLWMRFSAQVFNLCMKLHIPVTMENPFRSRIWLCPPMKYLLRRKQCFSVDVDYCAFGTRWRKRTKFLYYGVNLQHLGIHRCCNSKRGIRAFSGKPHLQLMGVTKDGVFMTKLAEPYPMQLCINIAHAFLDWHTGVIADNFWKRLWPDGNATMGG
eukprot:Skav220446  [mRNA]  locus=scaffold254:128743:132882:- [translate_table: standard]